MAAAAGALTVGREVLVSWFQFSPASVPGSAFLLQAEGALGILT